MSILPILNQLSSTSSRLEKESILANNKSDLMVQVLKAALDPNQNYWIRKIPPHVPIQPTNGWMSLSWAIDSLSDLTKRVVTGNDAINHLSVILSSIHPDDAEVINRIIAKDLKCGVSEATVNKIYKGLIKEYPYMRCSLTKAVKLDKLDWSTGIYVQKKLDGQFASYSHSTTDEVIGLTRGGNIMPNNCFEAIVESIKSFNNVGYQYHGEILIADNNNQLLAREIGNGMLNSLIKSGTIENEYHPVFVVWDMVPLTDITNGAGSTPYKTRFNQLSDCQFDNNVILVDCDIVHSLEEAYQIYGNYLSRGEEGAVMKDPNMKWEDGTSKGQIKLKLEVVVDLEIIGFNEGKGKNANLIGSIICATSDRLLEVGVFGLNEKQINYAHNNRNELIGKVIKVKGNDLMISKTGKAHSIFLPRAVDKHDEIYRNDKSIADTLQQVTIQFESAKTGK